MPPRTLIPTQYTLRRTYPNSLIHKGRDLNTETLCSQHSQRKTHAWNKVLLKIWAGKALLSHTFRPRRSPLEKCFSLSHSQTRQPLTPRCVPSVGKTGPRLQSCQSSRLFPLFFLNSQRAGWRQAGPPRPTPVPSPP